MQTHFRSFTPEWGFAFGQELADGFERRREFVDNTRHNTSAFLADFRRAHRAAAERAADGRRVFMSELRSGVHALRNRFQLDLRQMGNELYAAGEAFRSRHGRQAGFSFRTGERPGSQPSPSQEGSHKSGHSKKRHG